MRTAAVLFDFDGVIADTTNVHIAAWERTFARMGWDVPPEVCARAAEEDDRPFLAEVFSNQGVQDGDVDGWIRRKQELTRMILRDEPRLYPGVPALIERLRGQVRLAVVTTTWRENVEIVLRPSGLLDAFDEIISKADVKAPKPDPQAYRLALKRLGLRKEHAVALEDSPTGLGAAVAAGLRAVALGHRRGLGDWIGQAAYLPDLRETDAVVRALGLT